MASTTNYSWSTPDDTALVKDGAAAIRSLGSAIDSTVFTNAGAAVAKTIVDAKGDLIAATAADTVSRLAVGANDTVLMADSTAATGLKWGAIAAGGMTELATGTLSGSAVNVTSISGAYTNLYIVLVNYNPASANARCDIRFNNDSGTSYTTFQAYGIDANGTLPSQNEVRFATNQNDTTVQGLATLTIPFYSNATTWKVCSNLAVGNNNGTPTGANVNTTTGVWYNTAAITQVNLVSSSGNFDGGTYYIYGVK